MSDNPIQNVSDTALWIAAFRADETRRADAVLHDPFAERLAGTKGPAIVAITPNKEAMAFAMAVRTCAIDRLVTIAISMGVDTVVNLGAGMDTRPYRMQLSADLQWIEVDLPQIIDYKKTLLAGEKPNCRLEQIICDLSADNGRELLFQRIGSQSSSALIITEGVIAYLTPEQSARLSRSLYAVPSFRYWIMDYNQGKYRRQKVVRQLEKILVNAKFQFTEENPIGFFGRDGWIVEKDLHILDEAERIGRRFPLKAPVSLLMRLFRKRLRRIGNNTYGYVLFGKNIIL